MFVASPNLVLGDIDSIDSKRAATESAGLPDSKKPKLEDSAEDGLETKDSTSTNIPDVSTPSTLTEDAAASKSSQTRTHQKKKPKERDVSFKENPYTFLNPDDPILQSCV